MTLWRRKNKIEKALIKHCKTYDLPVELMAALIIRESAGNPAALRYEPAFFRRYIENKGLTNFVPPNPPLGITKTTERYARCFSYGLCQIMGQTAREHGYNDTHWRKIYNIDVNIELGCRILAAYTKSRKGDVRKGLLRYNGGGDKDYPGKIYRIVQSGHYKQLWEKQLYI